MALVATRGGGRGCGGALDDTGGHRTLLDVQCFDGFAAIEGRRDGASAIFVWPLASGADDGAACAEARLVLDGRSLVQLMDGGDDEGVPSGGQSASGALLDEGQWSVRLCPHEEQRYAGGSVRMYSSPVVPKRVLVVTPRRGVPRADYGDGGQAHGGRVAAGEAVVQQVWVQPAPAGFDASRYVCGRLWANASDGVKVPISVLMRREASSSQGSGGGRGGGEGGEGGRARRAGGRLAARAAQWLWRVRVLHRARVGC